MSESKELTVAEQPQQVALTVQDRAVIALGGIEREEALKALAKKYADITEIKNKAGRQQVHAAGMELANERIATKKTGETAREDANALQKAVIERQKVLIGITEPEERRLIALRDKWDEAEEAEKAAKAAAEAERIRGIKARIESFMLDAVTASGLSAAEIDAHATRLSEMVITLEEFCEFSGEAQLKRNDTVTWLRERQAAQFANEQAAIEAARQAEADRIERERVAEQNRIEARRLADLAAELERQAQEARDKQAEADRIAREKREATDRQAQAERDEQDRIAEARRAAAQKILDDQAAELRRQQDAADESARVVREAAEAAEKLEADHAEALIENARIDASAELLRQQAVEARMLREQQERERAETLAARYAPEPTSGTWSIGKTWGSIVTTAEIAGSSGTGHNDVEYYGGNLICESVWRPADACVLAAAHDMFLLLKELIDIEGPQPGTAAWSAKVKAVLNKATYAPEVQPEAQAA